MALLCSQYSGSAMLVGARVGARQPRAHSSAIAPAANLTTRSLSGGKARVRMALRTGDRGVAENVIPWVVREGATPEGCKLAVRQLGGGRGRGLVTTQDAEPGEVLLSVPFTHAFIEEDAVDAGQPWSCGMALRLLRILGEPEVGEEGGALLRPWAESLPTRIDTPPIQFSDMELAGCLDGNTVKEARIMRGAHLDGYEAVAATVEAMGLRPEDYDWAVSVLHSRCFVLQPSGLHITVPGIDMANHSFEPNAGVRTSHSPETCQGRSAVEDVCEPPEPEPSRFELVAGEAPIPAGEEVTISYGAWPNDLFFLLFGFVPDNNPHDAVVLFDGAEEALRFLNDTAEQSGAPHWKGDGLAGSMEAAAEALAEVDFSRLLVTWDGFDERLMQALHAAIQCHPAAEDLSAGQLAVERCVSLWSSTQTQMKQQRQELEGQSLTDNLRLSLQYSFHKQELLENALRSVGMLN